MLLKGRSKQWLFVAIFGVIFLGFVYWLNRPSESAVATAASQVMFERAHVSEVLKEEVSEDTWTEGLRIGTQEVVVVLDGGAYKGEELRLYNFLSAYGNVDLKEGSKIIVRLDKDENGNPIAVAVTNHDRSFMMLTLALLFGLSLVVFGGKKGLAAIFGLIFTIFSIWFVLIPLLQRGVPAIWAAILIVVLTTLVSLVALNGFSKKTWIAVTGCVGGVTMAGLIAMMAGILTPINGFNMPEAEDLVLRSSGDGLLISGLLVSGVLIASLGAVMDVALTIASAIEELHEMKPEASRAELFRSGLNIGRDTMGTMANTLILAFAGASLNMLVLFRVFDYPYLQIFNSDHMAIEIIQGLSGSIGLVLTVPLVASLASVLYGGEVRQSAPVKVAKNQS